MSAGDDQTARLQRRLERERRARREAEEIAERATSALYDRQRELELLESVAVAANEASTLTDALQVALEGICTHLGRSLGHAFLVDPAAGRLVSSCRWHIGDPLRFEAFRAAGEAMTFERGVGLPGRVLEDGEPHWIENLSLDASFPRLAGAVEAGIASAFAFPLLVGSETVGVIEIFGDLPAARDDGVLAVAAQIGTQLGRVVERVRALDELAHHAMHDALTGLPNRALLLDRLERALTRRDSALTAVLFIDLDRFKDVNDGAGHHAGDVLLTEVAGRLSGGLRAGDTIARLGGDEFVVLCEDLDDERQAVELAERFQQRMLAPFELTADQAQLVTASIGVAVGGRGATDAETLLRDADAAMYRAKDRGGGRHELFNQELRDRALDRLRTERALTRALSRDELFLLYQPIVSLDGSEVEGVEALVRWQDPELGLRSPTEFIPVAEESNLIVRLGEWVIGEACGQAARWRRELGDRAQLPVNVNLAARQLADERLPETVRRALEEAQLDPSDLALELTETALIEYPETPIRTLTALRALGVRIVLDDFGTGYSSLSYLQRFPIDELKIDRSFVAELGTQPAAGAIVEAIVGMGHSLGIRVVAEGIETEAQAAAVTRLGCDSGQGFLFARPAPAESIHAPAGSLTPLRAG